MEITVNDSDGVTILRLHGRFIAGRDGALFRRQVKELVKVGKRKLLFDFSGVPYIDSTGLGFLAGSRNLIQQAGASLVLAGVNERVMHVLEEVKLADFFVIVEDEARGLAKLKGMIAS
jgi:anti-anti-sigma factor